MDAFPEKGVQQAVERRKTASIEPFELDFDDIHEDDGLQAVCRMRFVSVVVADSLSCVDPCPGKPGNFWKQHLASFGHVRLRF